MADLRFYDLHQDNHAQIARELSAGLLAAQAHTSPKYLYDALGSRLFDAITELPEYYPTRTEATILQSQRQAIAASVPRGAALVDLGAGSCAKATSLFSSLQPSHYVAIDISVQYLRSVLQNLQLQHTSIQMAGVGMDFSSTLDLPPALMRDLRELPIAAFYPGSSISNFGPAQSLALLQRIRALCAHRHVLNPIAVDVALARRHGVPEEVPGAFAVASPCDVARSRRRGRIDVCGQTPL